MSNPNLTEWWPEQPLAIVIGAGGMGMAVARRLGQQHRLLVTDIDSAKLDAQVARLMEEGIRAEALTCDITEPSAVANLAAQDHAQSGEVPTAAMAVEEPLAEFARRVGMTNDHAREFETAMYYFRTNAQQSS